MINIAVVCVVLFCRDSIVVCLHLSEQGGGVVPESRLTVSHGADQL